MNLPGNILAALVTVLLRRRIIRQLHLPQAAVVNNSPTIYEIYGFILCNLLLLYVIILLWRLINPQAARQSISDINISSNKSLEQNSSASYNQRVSRRIDKVKSWLNNNFSESRRVVRPYITTCVGKELPLRIDSEESDISFPKRHSPRRERGDFEIDEAQPSTSGISNLKRPFSSEEDDYTPSKLRNTEVSASNTEIATNDSKDSEISIPKRHSPRRERGDFEVEEAQFSASGADSEKSEISFPKRHSPRRTRHDEIKNQPSTSGISNLKRPFTFEKDVYPPPKLRIVDDNPNPELIHSEMAADESTPGTSSSSSTNTSRRTEFIHPETATDKPIPETSSLTNTPRKTEIASDPPTPGTSSSSPTIIPRKTEFIHPEMKTDEPTPGTSSPPTNTPRKTEMASDGPTPGTFSSPTNTPRKPELIYSKMATDKPIPELCSSPPNTPTETELIHPQMATDESTPGTSSSSPTNTPHPEVTSDESSPGSSSSNPSSTPTKHRGPGRPRKS